MRLIDVLRRRIRDEQGIAMVTVINLSVVVLLLGAAATQVATVTVERSGSFRDDVAALHAAEAGISAGLQQLALSAGSTWCGVGAGSGTQLPGASGDPVDQQYAVAITDTNSADGPCTATDPVRVVRATGWSPSQASPNAATRMMEAEVRLVPVSVLVPEGFTFGDAVFANSATADLDLGNSIKVLRDGSANNADVYSNEDDVLANSTDVQGNLIAQGNVTISNSAHVFGGVYARGNITLRNSAQVDGNIISATGSILMQNSATVNGNAQAASTITLQNSAVVKGTTLPNSPSTPPVARVLPTFTWDASDPAWPQPIQTFASCAAFDTWLDTGSNKSNFSGTARITADCEWGLSNSETVTLTGDAAIVHDGWFTFSNSSKFQSTTGTRKLALISLHEASSGSDSNGIAMHNSFSLPNLTAFIYAANRVTINNSVEFAGQIYADRVHLSNSFEVSFKAGSVPGFTIEGSSVPGSVTSYRTEVLYLREVASAP